MPQTDLRPTAPTAFKPHRRTLRVRRWELGELLACGGLARVYRARPAGASPHVPAGYVLKLLRPRWHDDPRAVALLRREALVGRTVSHPHVISVLAASVSGPPYYVVMPWLRGSTLRARLTAEAVLPLHAALGITRQIASALEALARDGWMHGDVKPANVYVSPEGHVTLLDLGFARRSDEIGSVVERCVMGTWTYIAPEMICSALRGDIRSDIYSLGAVLYEMLAGRPPFVASEPADLAQQHRQAVPRPLRELAGGLPIEVARLVHRMLAKDPLRRPHSPSELLEQLVALEIDAFAAWMS